ncbi:hypothetical protein RZS08_20505, partial [Arthrospira platensis SPKY1]|nr:hypothetical protein [Arthrospira platensis SPKY1]
AMYRNKRATLNAEIYGRLMQDIVFYKNIIDSYNPVASKNAFIPIFTNSEEPDANIETGKGMAYGINIMAKFKVNNLNASMSFSSNRAFEKYDALNKGKWFPGKFDLSYTAGIALSYSIDKFRIFIDMNSHSGQHFTLPQYSYTGTDGDI